MQDMKSKQLNSKGFTLIETSIALVILVISLLGVGSVITYTTRYNSGAADRAMALSVAQQQMEKLRNAVYSSSELNSTTGTTTTVSNAGFSFTVLTIITDTTTTRKTITVQVSPANPSSSWSQAPVILITQRSALSLGPYIG
jgi:prepilin-type N-terminal cleavage/methylation domain-containing protein